MIETDSQARMPSHNWSHHPSGSESQRTSQSHNTPVYTSVTDIIRAKGSFWTAEDLAEVLSISRKHVYKLAKGGRIPCYRMGGAVRFDPEATAQWLERRAIN